MNNTVKQITLGVIVATSAAIISALVLKKLNEQEAKEARWGRSVY